MTDAAPDKEKRSHGAIWYIAGFLILYVASFLPVITFAGWLSRHDRLPQLLSDAIGVFYRPIWELLGLLGLLPSLNALSTAIRKWLP